MDEKEAESIGTGFLWISASTYTRIRDRKLLPLLLFSQKVRKKSAPGRKSAPLRLFLFFQQFFKLIELAQFDFMA